MKKKSKSKVKPMAKPNTKLKVKSKVKIKENVLKSKKEVKTKSLKQTFKKVLQNLVINYKKIIFKIKQSSNKVLNFLKKKFPNLYVFIRKIFLGVKKFFIKIKKSISKFVKKIKAFISKSTPQTKLAISAIVSLVFILSISGFLFNHYEKEFRPEIISANILDGSQNVKLDQKVVITLSRYLKPQKLEDKIKHDRNVISSVKYIKNNSYELEFEGGLQADNTYKLSLSNEDVLKKDYDLIFSTVESPVIKATNIQNKLPDNQSFLLSFNQGVFSKEYNEPTGKEKVKISFDPEVDFEIEYLSPSIMRVSPKELLNEGGYTMVVDNDDISNEYDIAMKSSAKYYFEIVKAEELEEENQNEYKILFTELLKVKNGTKDPLYLFLSADVNNETIKSNLDLLIDNEVIENGISVTYTKMKKSDYTAMYTTPFYEDVEEFYLVTIMPKNNWEVNKSYRLKINEDLSLLSGEHIDTETALSIDIVDDIVIEKITSYEDRININLSDNIISTSKEIKQLLTVKDTNGNNIKIDEISTWDSSIVVYFTKDLKGKSTYSLNMAKGLKNEFGKTLQKSLKVEFTTEEKELAEGDIYLEGPQYAYVENTGRHKLLVRTTNIPSVKMEIIKLDNPNIVNYFASDGASYKDMLSKAFEISDSNILDIKERNFKSPTINQYIENLNNMDDGVYLIRFSNEDIKEFKVINFSSNVVALKTSKQTSVAWIISAKDGSPYIDKTIFAVNRNNKIIKSVTNEDGIVEFSEYVKYIYSEDLSVFASDSFTYGVYDLHDNSYMSIDDYYGYLFSDRAIYKPGEEVKYKVFVKELSGNKYKPVSTEVEVVLSGFEEPITQTIKLNKFGTASGSIVIPADAFADGSYYLRIESVNNEKNSNQDILTNRFDINIQEFELHSIQGIVDLEEKEIYKSSDVVKLSVDSNYYFGQPLQDGDVEVTLYIRDTYNYFDNLYEKYDKWSFYDYSYFDDEYSQFSSVKLKTIKAKLNKDGHLDLDIPFTTPEKFAYGNGKTLSIEVNIKDKLGDSITLVKYATVSPKGGDIGANYQDNILSIVTVGEDLKPSRYKKLKVDLYALDWKDELVKEVNGVNYWTYSENKIRVKTIYIKTNSQGEVKTRLDISGKDDPKDYEIVITDVNNNRVQNTLSLYHGWAFYNGEDYYDRSFDSGVADTSLNLTIDKEEYKLGDTVKIETQIESNKYKALVATEKNGIIDYEILDKDKMSSTSINISEDMLPNVNVSIFALKTHECGDRFLDFKFGEINIPIAVSEMKLDVTTKTDKNIYVPKDTVKIGISSDKENEIEYFVAVVDKSVLDLQKATARQDIEEEMRRYLWDSIPTSVNNSTNLVNYENRLIMETKWGIKGGGGGDAAGFLDSIQAEDIRKDFKKSAYWMGSVITKDGKTSLEFELPDNLTTWNIFVIGYTKDGYIGTDIQEIISSKDVNLLSNISDLIYLSDQPEIMYSAVFSKDFEKLVGSKEVSIEVKTENGMIFCNDKFEKSCLSTVTLNEWPLSYKFKTEAIGDAKITLGVKYKDKVYDVLQNKITVKSPEKNYTIIKYGNTGVDQSVNYEFPDKSANRSVEVTVSEGLGVDYDKYKQEYISKDYKLDQQLASQLIILLSYQDKDDELNTKIEQIIYKIESNRRINGSWCNRYYCYYNQYTTLDTYRALILAKDAGFEINAKDLAKTKEYVKEMKFYNDLRKTSLSAYRDYVLSLEDNYSIDNLNIFSMFDKDNLSLRSKAYMLMTLNNVSKNKDLTITEKNIIKENIKELTNDLLKSAKRSNDFVYWKDVKNVESCYYFSYENEIGTNAVITQALLSNGKLKAELIGVTRYLQNALEQGYTDSSTMALVLPSLLDADSYIRDLKQGNEDLSVIVNGDKVSVVNKDENTYIATEDDFEDSVKLKIDSDSWTSYKIQYFYTQDIKDIYAKDGGLSIATEFFDRNGNVVDEFSFGQIYTMTTYIATQDDLQQSILTLNLPAGLEPVNDKLKLESIVLSEQLYDDNSDAYHPGIKFIHSEIGSDSLRLYTGDSLYGTSMKKGLYEYSVRVRAVSRGTYLSYGSEIQERFYPSRFSIQKGYEVVVK